MINQGSSLGEKKFTLTLLVHPEIESGHLWIYFMTDFDWYNHAIASDTSYHQYVPYMIGIA